MSDRVMYENLSVVTAPTDDPVTLGEAKAQSRILQAGEDALIESYLEAATAHLDGRDGILARALMPQTWDYTLSRFPIDDCIALPLAPVQTIGAITYKDVNGGDQTLSGSTYQLSADLNWRPRIRRLPGASWPGTAEVPDAVKIRATYGYALVPMPIRQAIILLTAHWYENREPVNVGNITSELPFGVRALLEPFMRAAF